ncbi:MAG: M28 family metallopeptidase [Clostridiales Family XIII bacterium]|nr:M28 family peptidase [Clostridia bacterium]MDY3012671.1 M28 family metallopeptidase [Clostridiales Family XIII bacterium]
MYKEAYEITRYLADECGVRLAGTPQLDKGSDYVASKLQEYGVDVEFHRYQIPVCNVTKSQVKVKLGEEYQSILHTAAMFAGETPKEGITLPLVYCGNGTAGELEQEEIRGKAVLICRDVYFEYPDLDMYKRLRQLGAAAVLYTTSDGQKGIPIVYANYEFMKEPYTIPTFVVSFEDATRIVQYGNTEVFLLAQYQVSMECSQNTIGIIEGSDPNAGNVIVCAHLDSTLTSPGASDNAGGVAVTLMMAKYLAEKRARGVYPKRTVRFIAWSGHECGLHGSGKFVREHEDIIRHTKFVLNYDGVGNALAIPKVTVGGQDSVQAAIKNLLDRLKRQWPVVLGADGVDTMSFAHKGIPHLTYSCGVYAGNHTPNDNMKWQAEHGFIDVIEFSKHVTDWMCDNTAIEHGYPEWLMDEFLTANRKYGWGSFSVEEK